MTLNFEIFIFAEFILNLLTRVRLDTHEFPALRDPGADFLAFELLGLAISQCEILRPLTVNQESYRVRLITYESPSLQWCLKPAFDILYVRSC